MNSNPTLRDRIDFELPFFNIRHISCPDDVANNRKVYVGHAPVTSIIGLSTDENVRDYLLEAEGKKRRRDTKVHMAIRETLRSIPENFSVLNSGITLVARDCQIDEKNMRLLLVKPSILNGSQTQGVITDFINSIEEYQGETDYHIPYVKFEIIVTKDENLIAEISISRNFQNDVMNISIVGRRGKLDDLDNAFQNGLGSNGKKLMKSETNKLSDDYVKTERLLQVIAALVPEELWFPKREFNKTFTYSAKAVCLRLFQELHDNAKDVEHENHTHYSKLYKFYLDIAAEAYAILNKWKTHQGFRGTALHSIKRDEAGKILDVPDGIVFPILASLSVFAKEVDGRWKISPPNKFDEKKLIEIAKNSYINIASSNPNVMGKSKACYENLRQITALYEDLGGK